jgi:hypothetical protein
MSKINFHERIINLTDSISECSGENYIKIQMDSKKNLDVKCQNLTKDLNGLIQSIDKMKLELTVDNKTNYSDKEELCKKLDYYVNKSKISIDDVTDFITFIDNLASQMATQQIIEDDDDLFQIV